MLTQCWPSSIQNIKMAQIPDHYMANNHLISPPGFFPGWLTFGHAPLNSHPFLARDWLSCFCAFADKTMMGLSSNSVGQPIMGLINFCYISWPLVGHTVSICNSGQTTQTIDLKLGGYIHYGTHQAWLTFSHASLNFCCFMASDLLSNFCTFADKHLIWFSWNLVGQLIIHMGFSWPD